MKGHFRNMLNCAYICASFQQLFTEKPSCQLTVVIPVAMSTEFDRGLEISEELNSQPKLRSRNEKNCVRDGVKQGRIQVLWNKRKKTKITGTAGVADDNQNSATFQLLVSEL